MRMFAIGLLLYGVVPVGATTLATSLILPTGIPFHPQEAGTTAVSCNFVNVSQGNLTVTVSLLDFDGHVLDTECDGPVPPQGGGWIHDNGDLTSFHEVWCSFSFSGPARALRAVMELYNVNTGAPLAVLPAN